MRSGHNLPPDIEALFTKTAPIQDVIELALGDQGTYFVSYRDHDGQVLAKHYNLPNALSSYLYHSQPYIIRDLATLSITLGPFESYYAWDKLSASWSNLPPKLEKSILNRLESHDAQRTAWKANGAEAPSFVTLGADEAYWMRTVSGGGCWDLKCSSKDDGMAGMRGINTFLEESNNFGGIAVSAFLIDDLGTELADQSRASISSHHIQTPTYSSQQLAKPFPTYQSSRGSTTTRWHLLFQPSCRLCCRYLLYRNLANKCHYCSPRCQCSHQPIHYRQHTHKRLTSTLNLNLSISAVLQTFQEHRITAAPSRPYSRAFWEFQFRWVTYPQWLCSTYRKGR